jgi:Integrase zinc binding domain
VVTDASALRWLMTLKENDGRLLRWAMRLQEYDLTVVYRPGKLNGNADGLSRLPRTSELKAPRRVQHADEDWPDVLPCFDAPPAGVKFTGSDGVAREIEHMPAKVSVATARGDGGAGGAHVAWAHRGHLLPGGTTAPWNLREVASAEHDGVAATLASLSAAEVAELLGGLDEDTVAEEDNVCGLSATWAPETPQLWANTALDNANDTYEAAAAATTDMARKVQSRRHQRAQQLADGMQRRGEGAGAVSDSDDESSEATADAREIVQAAADGRAPTTPAMLSRETFVQLQRRDAFCQAAIKSAEEGTVPEDRQLAVHFMLHDESYVQEEDGLLVRCARSYAKRGVVLKQWVVPKSLQPLVLRLGHDDASAAHAGTGATHARIFERFFWYGMTKDVRQYVQSCTSCLERKQAGTMRAPVQLVKPMRMWQRVHIDLVGAAVQSTAGYTYILTVTEARSGFMWLLPMRTKEASEAAAHVQEHWCAKWCRIKEKNLWRQW